MLAVAFVVLGMIYLGTKSRMDDARDPSAAAQIAIQDKQEKAYSVAPFVPYVESPEGTIPVESPGIGIPWWRKGQESSRRTDVRAAMGDSVWAAQLNRAHAGFHHAKNP